MNPVASDHGWDETHRMRRLEFRFELGAYVAGFRILLDDLGIETRSASCTRSRIVTFDARNKLLQYGAVGVVPVSVESTTSGALKGAAWGVFLAGPLGAAVGSMVGGGMKVAFELQTLEGEVLRCIAGKAAYLDIKKQVEASANAHMKDFVRKGQPHLDRVIHYVSFSFDSLLPATLSPSRRAWATRVFSPGATV